MRHLLTESLILAMLGGALGLLVSRWVVSLLLGLISPRAVPIDVGIDGRVLGFALLVSISSVLVFGLLPALRATRTELNSALKREGGVSDAAGGRWGLRETLLVAQVAIVNETFAQRFFGDRSPVGQRFGVEGEGSSQDV